MNNAPQHLPDGAAGLAELAARVLQLLDKAKGQLATAESCTGGLIASLLTDIEGLSSCFDRGFVVYSEEAKSQMLGIERIAIERHGAVSREIALAMAAGALEHSSATVAIAITGFAGPAGLGNEEGLVHIAVQKRGRIPIHRECHFGQAGRDRTRYLAARSALEMVEAVMTGNHPAAAA